MSIAAWRSPDRGRAHRSLLVATSPVRDLLFRAKDLFVAAIHLHHCSAPPLPSRWASRSSIRRAHSGMTCSARQRSQQTAIIDRLRIVAEADDCIVAEADDCAVANRTDLNRRHGSTCSGSNCQLTAGASPRTDKRSLRRDARRQAGQARQRRRDVSHDRLGRCLSEYST